MFKTHYLIGAAALALAAGSAILGLGVFQASAQNTAVPSPGGATTFDVVDTNHDGTISKAEFQAFAARMPVHRQTGAVMGGPGGGPDRQRFVHHLMPMDIKSLDKNGDGKVSFDEFAAPMKAHFAEMDANHDGFLDAHEMPQPPRDGGGMPSAPPPGG